MKGTGYRRTDGRPMHTERVLAYMRGQATEGGVTSLDVVVELGIPLKIASATLGNLSRQRRIAVVDEEQDLNHNNGWSARRVYVLWSERRQYGEAA